MKRLFIFLLLLPYGVFAQEIHRLEGYIQMPGAELASYFLQFTVKDTKVTGYSITNYQEGSRLRAALTGKLSPASELYIEETGTLDGIDSRYATYCYFQAHLKLTITNGRQRWSGPFESHQLNGKSCGSGLMTMMDEAPPLPEFSKPKPNLRNVTAPTVEKAPAVVVKPPPIPKDTPKTLAHTTPPRSKPIIIIAAPQPKQVELPPVAPDSNACARSYEWRTDSLSLDVWDGWTVDGDVVGLSVNGHMLLDHMKLSEVKKHIVVPLTPGQNTMILYLYDEGSDPPNTPNLVLFDGATQYELGVSGNSGEKIRICFNRSR